MIIYDSDIDDSGRRRLRCDVCGQKWAPTTLPPHAARHHCTATSRLPGDILHQMFLSLGIAPDKCNGECYKMQQTMNAWGPAGCREHREEILAHLRTAYSKTDWPTTLKAGVLAMAQGLPLTLDGLLSLAIERAEAKS